MATKANDFLEETTYSISNPKTDVANTDLTSDADYVISGDAMSSITSRLATQSFSSQAGRSTSTCNTASIVSGIARVKVGKNAKERAAGKLMQSHEKSKFIFIANNMTDHDLTRTASSGSDSWPFSSIKKHECVAALYDHSHFKDLNVVFTADDDQPGLRTVMLCAHSTDRGRGIGIYAGKIQANSKKINRQKVHDHELNGNKAAINNPGKHYLFEYDIQQLEYTQFGVASGKAAAIEAIEKFTTFCIGSMPAFTFVVNNLTGYDLTLSEKYERQGSWPLGNIKIGECAVAGFDQLNMSLAARYNACSLSTPLEVYQVSIWRANCVTSILCSKKTATILVFRNLKGKFCITKKMGM